MSSRKKLESWSEVEWERTSIHRGQRVIARGMNWKSEPFSGKTTSEMRWREMNRSEPHRLEGRWLHVSPNAVRTGTT